MIFNKIKSKQLNPLVIGKVIGILNPEQFKKLYSNPTWKQWDEKYPNWKDNYVVVIKTEDFVQICEGYEQKSCQFLLPIEDCDNMESIQ